jgi:6-phosphofructokinase 1
MKAYPWQKLLNDNGIPTHMDTPFSSKRLAQVLKFACNIEARSTVIGYTQRGALPTSYDSAFAFEAGHMAVELLLNETPAENDGYAIGVRDGRVYHTSLRSAATKENPRPFNKKMYDIINTLPYLPHEDDLILISASRSGAHN